MSISNLLISKLHKTGGIVLFLMTASGCSFFRQPATPGDHAFIVYWPPKAEHHKLRLAVKDIIDMKGVVTTAGSEYVAKHSPPAARDAACLARARQENVEIVGKTNLTEFAASVSGINTYFGTPRLRHHRGQIPGGSSSGSAVAVTTRRADVAFGTDTAGSIRIPAACCGILGLKTTFGLVPLQGVFPLSPKHLDTVGPMAKDIPDLEKGMNLLEAGFDERYAKAVAAKPSGAEIKVARLYIKGTDPAIDQALDQFLAAKHFRVMQLGDDFKKQWEQAQKDAKTVALADVWRSLSTYEDKPGVDIITKTAIMLGKQDYPGPFHEALQRLPAWKNALREVFQKVDFIALPTLQKLPPEMPSGSESALFESNVYDMQNTAAVNYAGNPALAIPVKIPGKERRPKMTSLQLIAPDFHEAELLNAGRILESKE